MKCIKGQITIFIALIFQVLFVFFAMLINVGMTVHDKVNLQNSIDLAAYYGAQKQAEILNVIAHVNFQIRQDWKLLSWRLRALGDSSRDGHPSNKMTPNFNQPDFPWSGALAENGSSAVSICMTNQRWNYSRASANENICGQGRNINIPQIPDLAVAFFPWDFAVQGLLEDLQEQFSATCRGQGKYNWYMAIRWMAAYRYQVGKRQRFIEQMATRLNEFRDIEGNDIEEGMRRTLKANLTRANLESLDNGGGELTVYNSMKFARIENWLPNTRVFPLIFYTDLFSGSGNSNTACQGSNNLIRTPPRSASTSGRDIMEEFGGIIYEPEATGANAVYHSTRGREKNPWYMIYVGAKISTRPRKPFFPFGEPVELVARAFAKPFGGRIGPWSKTFWLRGEGWNQEGEDIEPLMPPRFTNQQSAQTGPNNIPNFSRYPGDPYGLTSSPSLALVNSSLRRQDMNVDYYAHLPQRAMVTPLAFSENFQNPNEQLTLRRFEMAAVAPDVFDITYYSIQPNFYEHYLTRIQNSLGSVDDLPMDLGSFPNRPFSVMDQIEVANSFPGFQQAYFKVSSWEHLLTSWVPNATMDYSFSEELFGKCHSPPPSVSTDSNCVGGGRAGYSVKLISKSYLNSEEHAVGGNPEERGPIINPPGDF